jgi:hypothetical protein
MRIKKSRYLENIGHFLTEEEGFEPPVRCRTTVFKTEHGNTQVTDRNELKDIPGDLLQENLQDCSECLRNALPSELFEVVCEWEKLPEHVKDTIKMLVETAGKKSNNT